MFILKWLLWLFFLCGSPRSSFGNPSYEEHWHGSNVFEHSQHTSYGEGSGGRNFVFSNEHGYHDESVEKGMGVSWDVDHEGSFVPIYHHDQTSSFNSQLDHGFNFNNHDWDDFFQGDDDLTVSHGQVSHSMGDSSVIKRKVKKKTATRPGRVSHTTPSGLSAAGAWSRSKLHFVASSNYPFSPRDSTWDVVTTIFQTLKSPLVRNKKLRIGDNVLYRYLHRPRHNFTSLSREMGFLINLCLKNLAFLVCLSDGLHAPHGTRNFQEDLVKTLEWLNEKLDRDGRHYNRSIDTQLNQHYQTQPELNKYVTMTVTTKSKTLQKYITNFEAHQAGLILKVLEAYYKEKNPTKWAKLFDKDHTFLRFYLKMSYKWIKRGSKKRMETHEKNFRENHIPWLPWDKHWPDDKREMVNFIRQSTMFDNAEIEDSIDNSIGFEECQDSRLICTYK